MNSPLSLPTEMFLGIYLDHPHFQDLHSLAQEAIKTMTSSRSYQIISGKTNVKQFRGEYFYLSHDQGGRIFVRAKIFYDIFAAFFDTVPNTDIVLEFP